MDDLLALDETTSRPPVGWTRVTIPMPNQGASVIPPGQGMFFNNRALVTSILAYGEVRENDFIRPLAVGNNLVGGGYPLDQSATGLDGRR